MTKTVWLLIGTFAIQTYISYFLGMLLFNKNKAIDDIKKQSSGTIGILALAALLQNTASVAYLCAYLLFKGLTH
jgi:hypothetical protein